MKVAILLATFNGESHLYEQLDSILKQSHADWTIYASDDGSTDKTIEILEEFKHLYGNQRMHILKGPQKGFSSNFMSLVMNTEIQADYYAFCDQDDIWHPNKLEIAINKIFTYTTAPALYCSRTRLIDPQGCFLGMSAFIRKPPSFANALVQSIAGGNTMVFNNHARDLLLKCSARPIVSHDWWLYILISGTGGHVHYDHTPTVDYRQHPANLIGNNGSLRARVSRVKMGFNGRFKSWITINTNALEPAKCLLTPESQDLFEVFQNIRVESRLRAVTKLMQSGLHRQTIIGNIGLHFAVFLRRF